MSWPPPEPGTVVDGTRAVGSRSPVVASRALDTGRATRGLLALAYLVVLAAYVIRAGVPLERPVVLGWLMGALVIATVGRPDGGVWPVVRDWFPYGVALTAYDLSRGAADTLGMPLHSRLPIRIDRFVFLGHVPTVDLQRWLGPITSRVAAWEIPATLVYSTHFVVPFLIPAVLWARDRVGFRQWRARFFTLVGAGLTTFALLPTVPPWMASRRGLIGPVRRVSSRGWERLGVGVATRVIDLGGRTLNDVAAVPSLHAAFSLLAVTFCWPRVRARWRPLLAAYPLAMAVTLVATGEHYVFDVLVGWTYAAAAATWWTRIERRRAVVGASGAASSPPIPQG